MNDDDIAAGSEDEFDDEQPRDPELAMDEEPEVTARADEFDDEELEPTLASDDLVGDLAGDLAPDDLEPGAYEDDDTIDVDGAPTPAAAAAPASPDDDAGRFAAIEDALRDLATNVAGLGALEAGLAAIRDRLAGIENDVAYLRQAAIPERPSLGALLGDEPPVTATDADDDETLPELLGPMPRRPVAVAPVSDEPEPEPEVELEEPEAEIAPTPEPALIEEPLADDIADELEEDLSAVPVPLYAPAPEPEEEPEPVEELRDPVPLHPVALAEPEVAPQPEPPPAPTQDAAQPAAQPDEEAADGRFGLGSSVLLRVAPVSGFQDLTRVQGALGRVSTVRRATVEAYSRGEARLVAELAEATSASSLAESLGANLNRIARVQEVSEEPPVMQITLA